MARTYNSVQILVSRIVPYYDPESQTLTYVAEEYEDRDGEVEVFAYSVRTLSYDGTENLSANIVLTGEWMQGGFVEQDRVYSIIYQQDENGDRQAVIGRYDLDTNTWLRSEDILHFFREKTLATCGLTIDTNGNFCVSSTSEILVLSPKGELICSIMLDKPGYEINKLVSSQEGRLYAELCRNNRVCAAAEIFTGEGKIADPINTEGYIYGGTGRIPFYYMMKDGLWAKSLDSSKDRLILNFANSGLSLAEMTPIQVSDEVVILLRYQDIGNQFAGGTLELYVPGDDIDLRSQAILELAYFDSLPSFVMSAINSFNREHLDMRIVATDWSGYNTTENPEGGYDKLLRDMITGRESPDILIGGLYDSHISGVYENGLYTNIIPYLEVDDTVNRKNLFGCVLRMFDDGKEGIWGISPNFIIDTSLVSTSEFLGEYEAKGFEYTYKINATI